MDMKSRIARAKTAFMNKRNLLRSKNTSMRKRLIKVYDVWSVALYGCESWALNKVKQKFLESFEMWCWRRMLRVSIWTERRTNENVLNEINYTRKILSTAQGRGWNMIGHVLRPEEELLIIEEKMNGKRDRGRPRTSYIKRMIFDSKL